jgi:hypothetical protein
MKNLKLTVLLFAALTVSLSSCRKSRSPQEEVEKPETQAQIAAKSKIVGKWYIKKAVFTYPNNPTPRVYTEYDQTQFYEFKSDGSVSVSYVEKQGNFSYKFSEDAQALGLYTPHPNDTYKVKLLTETDLILEKEHTIEPIMTEEITLKK